MAGYRASWQQAVEYRRTWDKYERDYAACMEPRGYVVTPWRAGSGEQVTKAHPDDRTSSP